MQSDNESGSLLPPSTTPVRALSPFLKYFMTVACGIVVANLYYCQPLLATLADSFEVSEAAASWINICAQMGYGLGLLFVVPLGDMISRRTLLFWMILFAMGALLLAAVSTGIAMLYIASICIGITSTACQIFVPLAAHLSSDDERGKVIGTVMGGLLSGILLSRTLSGLVAEHWGWRMMFWIAAGLMIIMALLVRRFIPDEDPSFSGGYQRLMDSLRELISKHQMLRESAWMGACFFGSISAFWSTMAFFLEKPPFEYPLSMIGLFGIIGLAGALISPLAGKTADRKGPLLPIWLGIAGMLAGYAILYLGIWNISIVVIGIILIDMGLQAAHIPNLSRVSALLPEARTRLNTLYMTSFFAGGTFGSIVGSLAWNAAGWPGVCTVGLLMVLAGAAPLFFRRFNLLVIRSK